MVFGVLSLPDPLAPDEALAEAIKPCHAFAVFALAAPWFCCTGRRRSAHIFHVDKFPATTFVVDKFGFNADQVSEVAGQLTIKGKTHPVALKARQFNCYQSPMLKRAVCGGDFEATIDRTLWDLNYGLPAVAPKEVSAFALVGAIRHKPRAVRSNGKKPRRQPVGLFSMTSPWHRPHAPLLVNPVLFKPSVQRPGPVRRRHSPGAAASTRVRAPNTHGDSVGTAAGAASDLVDVWITTKPCPPS